MIEALVADPASLVARLDTAAAAAGGGLRAPAPADVVRFENALDGNRPVEIDPEAPSSVAPGVPDELAGRSPSGGSSGTGIPTLGDRVLDSLQNMSSEFKRALNTPLFNPVDGGPRLAVGQMLELQRSLIAVSINIDLTTKVVSKTGQNVDQLVRTQ